MSEGGGSIAARLAAARQRAFVGREGVIDLFRQGLEGEVPPFVVLFVHGPGGVGKTTLVRRLVTEARTAGAPVHELDGHALPATNDAVLGALGAASLEALPSVLGGERTVVVIDTYEMLAPLDDWIRDRLTPALPAGAILVLSGREPPSPAWRVDPGWASLMATVALANLTAEESHRLLAVRGVAEGLRRRIHELTYGHPLALALVADVLREGGDALPELTPNVVGTLLDSLLRALPSERHREALVLASLTRFADRSLLSCLDGDDGGELFEWLRALSFVEATADGLYVHDIVRDALFLDANTRDPERAKELRDIVARRAGEKMLGASVDERNRVVLDLIHVFRGNPEMRPFYDWHGRFGGSWRPMRPEELPTLLELAVSHEGPEAERIARDLYERHPDGFVALQSADGSLSGFLVYLRLDAAELAAETARRTDPVMDAVTKTVEGIGPLRAGERVGLLRFWLWIDAYQDIGSPTHVPHTLFLVTEWASCAGLGPAIAVVQRADVWESFLTNIDLLPVRDLVPGSTPVDVGGRAFHLFAHDFRIRPPTAWFSGVRLPASSRPRRVLTEAEFAEAVRAALRACAQAPDELSSSPLLTSRTVVEWAEGEEPTAEMIRELLQIAISSMADARDDRPKRAVEVTFLKGAPTQEIAAERLGLTFSTYRRALARGIDAVVAYLWKRETAAG